ncbi:hypothetical protein YWS52_03450 [Chitiniphilus shinanonensis]
MQLTGNIQVQYRALQAVDAPCQAPRQPAIPISQLIVQAGQRADLDFARERLFFLGKFSAVENGHTLVGRSRNRA